MTFQERVLPIDHFELFNFPSIKELILEWQKQGLKYVRIVINDSVTNNIIHIKLKIYIVRLLNIKFNSFF